MKNKLAEGIILEPPKKPSKDSDSTIFRSIDYGIDINRRVIYYSGAVDIHTAEFINQRIDCICDLTNNYKAPIDLDLTSPGGDVYGMLGAIDILQNSPVDINVLGRGMIMSAATLILMAASGQRSVTPNSTVMIHHIRSWIEGTTKDIFSEVKHLEFLQEKVYDLYAKYSNKKRGFFKRKSNEDWYLTPKECLEYNIIDKITGA
jgi:ATP-dependent Clp protease protease subunit